MMGRSEVVLVYEPGTAEVSRLNRLKTDHQFAPPTLARRARRVDCRGLQLPPVPIQGRKAIQDPARSTR